MNTQGGRHTVRIVVSPKKLKDAVAQSVIMRPRILLEDAATPEAEVSEAPASKAPASKAPNHVQAAEPILDAGSTSEKLTVEVSVTRAAGSTETTKVKVSTSIATTTTTATTRTPKYNATEALDDEPVFQRKLEYLLNRRTSKYTPQQLAAIRVELLPFNQPSCRNLNLDDTYERIMNKIAIRTMETCLGKKPSPEKAHRPSPKYSRA